MKTEAANALCEHIMTEARRLEDTARRHAVNYASDDRPEEKAAYLRYAFAAEEVRKLHAAACQALHSLERLIPDDKASHAEGGKV